jgi:ATP/maltotriose-dependent transcriptional regulator MalT/DNA-binding SARP family transcriptional activator
MSPTRPLERVDSRPSASVSFPAPESPVKPRLTAKPNARVQQAIGPGRTALVAPEDAAGGGPTVGMTSIPVQPSKVQAPPLRDETLPRERLLDWLSVKIHNRIVLLAAEAGYGKTTLLADFSRRTRVRMLWYRIDLTDRDPMVFLHHLVGAVRMRIPDGSAAAFSLLSEVGPTGPALDVIVEAFVRGLSELPNDATALVLDDYHVIEDSPDIRPIVREIVARAPERLTLVFSSRKLPQIPIARLRAQGEVAELRTADLRFDESETERLFRDSYAMPLEPGIASELAQRTEGWAASLQLVQSAIRGRSTAEIRSFVHSLSGAEGDLYDYLAEEVVGELPEDLQLFLMRTSVLDTIDPEFGAVAAGLRPDDVRSLIEDAERAGLLSRRGSVGRHVVRSHPLVRDFLQARLRRAVGDDGVAAIHRRVAVAAEPLDWALSGRHFAAAGDPRDVRRVLHGAIDSILSSGAYATAATLLEADDDEPDAVTLVIRSREAMQSGDLESAVRLGEIALDAPKSGDFAAINALSMRFAGGLLDEARLLAADVERDSVNEIARRIARSTAGMLESSLEGSLSEGLMALQRLQAALPEGHASGHYWGVSKLNSAHYSMAMGDPLVALANADEAIDLLKDTSTRIEAVSARLIRARALAHQGQMNEARNEARRARSDASRIVEAAAESAEIELLYGDADLARAHLAEIPAGTAEAAPEADLLRFCRILLSIRDGRPDAALVEADKLRFGQPATSVAMEAGRHVIRAHSALSAGHSIRALIPRALEISERQGAEFWRRYALLLAALAGPDPQLSREIASADALDGAYMTLVAEIIATRLAGLDSTAFECVEREVLRHPDRWRPALREAIGSHESTIDRAGPLLEAIGTADDVPRLRSLSRRRRAVGPDLGRTLARRLAAHVQIEDLGRVSIEIGPRRVEATELRRKVLALLCFLVTRARFSATREEVIETLWPALEPSVAVNSLNQTVYFLRRVFEPRYTEDLSPGYVAQDAETVWLDAELISARSELCRRLLRALPTEPNPDQVLELQVLYRGRFALDFAYEDWAADYRESIHAAYLRVVEGALRHDLNSGNVDRGIAVAERAMEVESDSDELQAMAIRLYRIAGHHAAAAEQYAQYSRSLLGLGVDPPPIEKV